MAKKRLSKSSLLWLVRSRSYISVADVRRRFNVDASDDVTAMIGPGGHVYVGLPAHQAQLLEDLWRDGKVGLELAPDVKAPIVTGVYGIFRRGEYIPLNGNGVNGYGAGGVNGAHVHEEVEEEDEEIGRPVP